MSASSGGNTLVVRKRIPVSREEVFDAWIDPQGMRIWMCPGNVLAADVRMDPRVGGSLLIIMRNNEETFEHRGQFTIVDRPAKLAFTWISDATDSRPTLVTVEFLALADNQTELVLTHEKFPRAEARDQYRGGWSQIVNQLEEHLHRKH